MTTRSTLLQEFAEHSGRPEWSTRVLRVIRELERFPEEEAINGISPIDEDGFVGIGVNYQRGKLPVLLTLWFSFLAAGMIYMSWPLRFIDPESHQLTGAVLALPVLGGFALLGAMLWIKKPGPDLVIVADATGLYAVSRTRLRWRPHDVLVPWLRARIQIHQNSVTHNLITTNTVSVWAIDRQTGKKSHVCGARVDAAVFDYFTAFARRVQRFG